MEQSEFERVAIGLEQDLERRMEEIRPFFGRQLSESEGRTFDELIDSLNNFVEKVQKSKPLTMRLGPVFQRFVNEITTGER